MPLITSPLESLWLCLETFHQMEKSVLQILLLFGKKTNNGLQDTYFKRETLSLHVAENWVDEV